MGTPYQDVWIKGQLAQKGYRECEDRYEVLRAFCSQYSRPFTVLDLGANMGYFSVRLVEDFPECTAIAVEGRPDIGTVLTRNENPRVVWLKRMLDVRDLWRLAHVEAFDVVLAMSVVHHIHADPAAVLEVLPLLGDYLIMEVPNEDTACAQERVQAIQLPADAMEIGRGKSHLNEGTRPIVLVSRPKCRIDMAYIGSPRADLGMTIYSDFHSKTVQFWTKREAREWHRGINLQTYLMLGGSYPSPKHIAGLIRREAVAGGQAEGHRDIAAWNIVLQGDAVQFIDRGDPHTRDHDDRLEVDALIESLETSSG